MSRKTRKTFLGKPLEGLEDRALLSGYSLHLPSIKIHGIHVQVVRHKAKAHETIVRGGPLSTTYTTPANSGAVTAAIRSLNAGTGNSRIAPVTPVKFVQPTTPTTGVTTTSVPLSSIGQTPSLGSVSSTSRLIGGGVFTARQVPISLDNGLNTTTISAASLTSSVSVSPIASPSGIDTATPTTPMGTIATPMAPPSGMFGATLNASEVASFKSSIDTFAANYTSGANATKDAAAVSGLQTGLSDVALSVWSRTNVASSNAVAQFKTAADTFANTYTSGTNPTQDSAAWKSLQSAMNVLGSSLTGPNIDPKFNANIPGIYRLTSIPAAQTGDFLGLGSIGTISASDVASVKTAADTFAANYTSGANQAKDQAADLAFETAIGNISTRYWQAQATNPGQASSTSMAPGSIHYALATNSNTLKPTVTTTSSGTPNGIG